jgi:D-arabinose 1-dehydrogenase-like Zn-dependent alcohol dehydrogenase
MRKIYWKQISLLGTTMGSPADWSAMLAFVGLHGIKPVISDVLPFERATDGFDLLERGGGFGKVVVRF